MTHPHDNIRVGAITFVYSVTKRSWGIPGLSVIQNPLKAQRLAEEINNKRGAICTKHLPLS
ncbi:phage protein [Escherichia coli]|uniref:Phage protein n=1 Tax=Escherichia coli TaxID=562 RepID=A0A376W2U1_ECOLX|nr:phage protein [Escherichia coli]